MRISDWSSDVCSSDLISDASTRFSVDAEDGTSPLPLPASHRLLSLRRPGGGADWCRLPGNNASGGLSSLIARQTRSSVSSRCKPAGRVSPDLQVLVSGHLTQRHGG